MPNLKPSRRCCWNIRLEIKCFIINFCCSLFVRKPASQFIFDVCSFKYCFKTLYMLLLNQQKERHTSNCCQIALGYRLSGCMTVHYITSVVQVPSCINGASTMLKLVFLMLKTFSHLLYKRLCKFGLQTPVSYQMLQIVSHC